MKVFPYIKAVSQISIQEPLTDVWMESPHWYDANFVKSIDPDFKPFVPAAQGRRMGKLLKRALTTSLSVIRESGIACPDAIMMGTGLGCIESTERFLESLCRDGEQLLKPTHFMQSTHNTVASLIGIQTGNTGYNITYSHKGISVDCALHDALVQFKLGMIGSALVGGNDEVSPSYFTLLKKIGFVGQDSEVCGEASVAMMLSNEQENALCQVKGVKVLYRPDVCRLQSALSQMLSEADTSLGGIDAVMTGISGNRLNDKYYYDLLPELLPGVPVLHYKHIFGESYSASGLGVYATVRCLQHGFIPQSLVLEQPTCSVPAPNRILLLNIADGKDYSFILLEKICGK